MLLRQVLELYDLLDDPAATGEKVATLFRTRGAQDVTVTALRGKGGATDCIAVSIPGTAGRVAGGTAPTLGIIGRLGGLGARPAITGFVSDGDGALAALAAGLKLAEMKARGDALCGDVIVRTHICPGAPTQDHEPVPFMGSPVDMDQLNAAEVSPEMDALLSIDTTKGNEIINGCGIAISPTVMDGYILPVSPDLLQVMKRVSGRLPAVFALSTQDITPYANGLPHLNSILQPSTATAAPVVGVAITTEVPVAGCATGASHFADVELAARYAVEVAKDFGAGRCSFYDPKNRDRLLALYGSQANLRTRGRG